MKHNNQHSHKVVVSFVLMLWKYTSTKNSLGTLEYLQVFTTVPHVLILILRTIRFWYFCWTISNPLCSHHSFSVCW